MSNLKILIWIEGTTFNGSNRKTMTLILTETPWEKMLPFLGFEPLLIEPGLWLEGLGQFQPPINKPQTQGSTCQIKKN